MWKGRIVEVEVENELADEDRCHRAEENSISAEESEEFRC